jgi:mannose-1-phosphate guanylyltransferase
LSVIRAIAGQRLWSVVLAGGEGERTRPFIESWLGYHKPKQYCVFSGERSLFQSTVDRADALGSPGRRVTVVARHHVDEARAQLQARGAGILIPQPSNRGTAAGILLALTRIQAADRDAIVVVYPSDHFVYPEGAFLSTVARAVAAVVERPERLVLLGVVPDGPEPDYGWALPGAPVETGTGSALREVAAFLEKPSRDESQALMARGALWNSMVLAGTIGTFWGAAARTVPELVSLFTSYREFAGTSRGPDVLERIYQRMPSRDFSKHVLERARDVLAVLPMTGVLWSDWGRPERIARTLKAIGAEPAFSTDQLEAASTSLTRAS